jgi:hypothetical protein
MLPPEANRKLSWLFAAPTSRSNPAKLVVIAGRVAPLTGVRLPEPEPVTFHVVLGAGPNRMFSLASPWRLPMPVKETCSGLDGASEVTVPDPSPFTCQSSGAVDVGSLSVSVFCVGLEPPAIEILGKVLAPKLAASMVTWLAPAPPWMLI